MMIDCVKAYMNTCPLLSEIIPKKRHIDFTEDSPDNYGIFPSGDTETGNSYINVRATRSLFREVTLSTEYTIPPRLLLNYVTIAFFYFLIQINLKRETDCGSPAAERDAS